ncbi:MAG: shikimate dehydrogenase [Elusimicrobiota bacterium]
MIDFACIVHPLDLELFSSWEPEVSKKKKTIITKLMEWIKPFKVSRITSITSLTGKTVLGELMLCILIPEQIQSLESKLVLTKAIEAGKYAQDLGAKIISFNGYLSQVGRKGLRIAEALDVPITTGASYTVAATIETIYVIAERLRIDLSKAKLVIIGASGNIGSICAAVFANKVRHLILVARNETRLKKIAEKLKNKKVIVEIEKEISKAANHANIIITATNTPFPLIDLGTLSPGTIVCDVSRPRNVDPKNINKRNDVLILDGGLIKPPGEPDFNFYYGLPSGLCYACMAEAMILALEERYESYSIGTNITLEKVIEIGYLAKKHGFGLAEFRSFNEIISEDYLNCFKKYTHKISS